MTLKQKIENLTWADLVKKLKDILTNFSTKFDNLTGRVSTLESNSGSGGGGGSQDLQSVLENGNEGEDFNIVLKSTSDDTQGNYSYDGLNFNNDLDKSIDINLLNGSITVVSNLEGYVQLSTLKGLSFSDVLNSGFYTNIKQTSGQIGDITLLTPIKPIGTYTLATIEDFPNYVPNLNQVLQNGNLSENTPIKLGYQADGFGNTQLDGYQIYTQVKNDLAGIGLRSYMSGNGGISADMYNYTFNSWSSVISIAPIQYAGTVYGILNIGRGTGATGQLQVDPTEPTENASIFYLPKYVSATPRTLATLDDINAVGSLIPTFADNASAVTGGLAVNHLYKTASGEIRVRV